MPLAASTPRRQVATTVDPRTLAGVDSRRRVVDYGLQRRSVLAGLRAGRASVSDVCDATPYLIQAARYHGEVTETPCPVCCREPVWHVHYIYGDALKASAGQARRAAELARIAASYAPLSVYVVEVCRTCGWNHLWQSYVLDGGSAAAEPVAARGSR